MTTKHETTGFTHDTMEKDGRDGEVSRAKDVGMYLRGSSQCQPVPRRKMGKPTTMLVCTSEGGKQTPDLMTSASCNRASQHNTAGSQLGCRFLAQDQSLCAIFHHQKYSRLSSRHAHRTQSRYIKTTQTVPSARSWSNPMRLTTNKWFTLKVIDPHYGRKFTTTEHVNIGNIVTFH